MSKHQEFESKIKELRSRFNQSLPHKLKTIELGWVRLCSINWSQALLEKLVVIVQQLAVSAKSFGYERLGAEVKELHTIMLFLQHKALPPSVMERDLVEDKINQLLSHHPGSPELASSSKETSAEAVRSDHQSAHLVYLLDADVNYLNELKQTLCSQGFNVRAFTTLKEFGQALKDEVPAMVCLDLVFPEGKHAGITAVEMLREQTNTAIPVVFISSRNDMVARLKALRVGAKYFLTKPVDQALICCALENALPAESEARVLLVNYDEDVAAKVGDVLHQGGFRVDRIADPIEVLAALHNKSADLVVVDYQLPHCTGIEVAELLLQDQRYCHIPILFLADLQNQQWQQQAFALSGQLPLDSAIDDHTLLSTVQRIVSRAKRSSVAVIGSAGGIANGAVYQGITTPPTSRFSLFCALERALEEVAEGEVLRHVFHLFLDRPDYLKRRFGLKVFSELEEQFKHFLFGLLAGHRCAQMRDDYFLVMSFPMSVKQALEFCELVSRSCADRQFFVDGHEVQLTLSIGITAIDKQVQSIEQCLGFGEEAREIVNQRGGRGVVYWPESALAGKSGEIAYESRILKAIEDQSFRLVFQAIVNLDEPEKLYECRVRLVDADDNVQLPSQFLPTISKHKLQLHLDRWVIRSTIDSLTSLSGLEREETNLIVKINPESYRIDQIISFAANLVRSANIKGRYRLMLQVDESWAVSHQDGLRDQIKKLNSVGIGFVLDHVGESGYDIELIKEIVPNMIKLDKSLIIGFSDSDFSRQKLAEMLAIASKKDIRVIASSVEEAKVFASLWGMGVRYFQGYFIQQPGRSLNFDFQNFKYG